MAKVRLDSLVFEKGFVESREKAKTTIMSGIVFVNDQKIDKPGTMVDPASTVEVRGNILKYVSRGGLKLEKAIDTFDVMLDGKVCLDVGASTGGFTDCMLQNGAVKVFAIDVGYGQLAWKLRSDERVVCMERTNVRYVTPEDIGVSADFCSIDVSFISLKLVLPVIKTLLSGKGEVLALIKPQFEAGRENVGKKGVVRDPKIHKQVIDEFLEYSSSFGFFVRGLTYSPIKGPEGNIEYLGWLSCQAADLTPDFNTEDLVIQSHRALDK